MFKPQAYNHHSREHRGRHGGMKSLGMQLTKTVLKSHCVVCVSWESDKLVSRDIYGFAECMWGGTRDENMGVI